MRVHGEDLHIVAEGHNPLDHTAPEVYVRPVLIPVVIGVLLLACCFTAPYMFTAYAVPALNQTITWTPEPTITPTLAPTYTPLPTYTPFPTLTPAPTSVILPTTTPPPTRYLALPTPRPVRTSYIAPADVVDEDFREWHATAEAGVNVVINLVPTLPALVAISDSAPVQSLNIVTYTATPIPTPTAFWVAWHVVDMEVRVDTSRDGSSVVRNVLLDANDNVTHSLDIKCRMSNHSQDLRVNESWSQKVLFENGVPGYTFYINQNSQWDVQFYRYVSAQQAIDISELLKLPVGRNQIISIYWQFGETPLVAAAHVNPGPGVDNGRAAPVSAAPASPVGEPQVIVIVVTATPSVPPTQTPWIIRADGPTPTPFPTTTPLPSMTALPTGSPEPTYTPFWLVTPATRTPTAYPAPATLTPAVLSPLSDSAASAAHRCRLYLPVILKR